MALHPDLLDKHLLLLSRPAILNPTLSHFLRAYTLYTLYAAAAAGSVGSGREKVEIDLRCQLRRRKQSPRNWDDRRKSRITKNNCERRRRRRAPPRCSRARERGLLNSFAADRPCTYARAVRSSTEREYHPFLSFFLSPSCEIFSRQIVIPARYHSLAIRPDPSAYTRENLAFDSYED